MSFGFTERYVDYEMLPFSKVDFWLLLRFGSTFLLLQ